MNEIGSIASIISLLLTIWVAWGVRSLHAYYKRHLLIPDYVLSLNKKIKNIRASLDGKRIQEARDLMPTCDAIFERIHKHMDTTAKNRIASARSSIKKNLEDPDMNFINTGYESLRSMSAAVESIRTFTGEDKWKT